ncbi:MAG: AraC family transcriptional regulator [Albidovulum sp.]|nr:AraC family transcriptional regulator [Albidovulum sp.]
MADESLIRVSQEGWLDTIANPSATLVVSHYGYTDHALQAVPIVDRRLDRHLLWFVVDHHFEGSIEGERIELEAGALLWIRPGARHSFTIPRGLRTYRLRIDLSNGGRSLTLMEDWTLATGAWELRAPLEELLGELEVKSAYREYRLRQLVGTISLIVFRGRRVPAQGATFSATQRFRIQKLAVDRLPDCVSPAILAEELKLSRNYFSRMFKRTYGMPPRTWLVHQRLRQAATLLIETDHRIGEIARVCGYDDPNLFSRQFRKVYRQSPRDMRRGRSTGPPT